MQPHRSVSKHGALPITQHNTTQHNTTQHVKPHAATSGINATNTAIHGTWCPPLTLTLTPPYPHSPQPLCAASQTPPKHTHTHRAASTRIPHAAANDCLRQASSGRDARSAERRTPPTHRSDGKYEVVGDVSGGAGDEHHGRTRRGCRRHGLRWLDCSYGSKCSATARKFDPFSRCGSHDPPCTFWISGTPFAVAVTMTTRAAPRSTMKSSLPR